jgi:tetratricopeptide (TPR) repeat protein
MRQRWITVLTIAAVAGLCALPALGQGAFGKVSGTCKDAEGKPIAGAIVRWQSQDTGQKYDIKTNSKGEYMSIGIAPAQKYKVTLIGADGKEIEHVDNVNVQTGDNDPVDFDVKKAQQQTLQKQGMTEEQAKQAQEQIKAHDEAVAKERDTVKQLQAKLDAADAAVKANDYETAIAGLTEATQMDATRDIIWYRLAEAYAGSVPKQTDAAEKTKRMDSAIADYQKAIDIRKKDMESPEAQKLDAAKQAAYAKNLAGYYNGLGNAYTKEGKTDEAVDAYNNAAKIDASNAGMYYFNLGAALTNANKSSDQKMARAAADAFEKAVAADPTKADAYYWKGSNLAQLATLKGDKMEFPDGTAEAFQKYLELKPDGPHAAEAKAMLEGMGATVETSYGAKKKAPPKK